MSEKICSYANCHHLNSNTATHCAQCGRKLVKCAESSMFPTWKCPWECGHENLMLTPFCAKCGRAVSSEIENLRSCTIYDEGTRVLVSYGDTTLSKQDKDAMREALTTRTENRLRRVGVNTNKDSPLFLLLDVMRSQEVLYDPRRVFSLVTVNMEFNEPLSRGNSDEVAWAITWHDVRSWVRDEIDEEYEDLLTSEVEDLADDFGNAVQAACGQNRLSLREPWEPGKKLIRQWLFTRNKKKPGGRELRP